MATQKNIQQPVAFHIQEKFTSSYYWLRCILPNLIFLLLIVTSCGLPGLDSAQSDHKNNALKPTPIAASYTPARILQTCFDTYPLVPDPLFRSSISLVADMLESPGSIHLNEGAVQVYISYITSFSYLKDAFSFSVPALGADQEPVSSQTPNPASYDNPYDLANAKATVISANATTIATAQAQWSSNHEQLRLARDLVRKYANKLRSLPNIADPQLEDVAGCLQSASGRMAGFDGNKTIILASPIAQSASSLPFIDLSSIAIEVINRNCVLVSPNACIASAEAWRQKLLSFGASSVSIHDPLQSQVEKPTF